jgi:hypothetical protein
MGSPQSGNDISWLALVGALVAMFVATAAYRGIPLSEAGDAGMLLVRYLGTFLAAMFLGAVAVAILFSLGVSRGEKYRTPRRDYVLACLIAIFLVLAGTGALR